MSPHHPPASLRSRGEGRRHRSRPSDATSTIRSQAAVRPISHSRAPSKQTITNLDASPFAVTDRFSVEAVRSEINRIQRKFASAKLSISNEEAAIAAMDSLLGKPNIWEQALNRLIAVSNIMGQSSDDENDGSESVNSRSRGTSDRTVTSDHSRQSPIEVLQNDTETNFTQELDSDDEELRWSRMILASQMGPVFRLPSRDTLYRMEERRHLQQAQQGGGEKNESQTLSNKGNPDQIPVDLVYAITKQYHERHPDESSPMSGAIPWPEYAKMVKDQGTMEEEEEKKRLVQEDLLYNQPGANEGQILDTDSLLFQSPGPSSMSEKKRGEMPVRPPLDSISEAHVTGETRAANQSSTTIEIAELDSKEIQPGYYQHLVNVASKLKFSTVSDMKRFMFENHLEIQQLRSRYNGSQSTLPASESAAGPANRSFQPRPNNVYPDLPTSDAAEHRPPHSRASGLWSKHHELGSSTPAATSSHSSVPLQERPKPRSPGQYTIYRPIKKKTMNRNMETEGFTHGRYSEEMLHSASYASDRRSLSQAEEEPHHEWEDSPSVYSQNSQYSPGEQEEQWYQGPDRSSPEHSVYEDYLPQQKSSDAPYQSRRSSPGQAYDRFWSPPETPSRLQPREYGSHQDAYQPTSPRGSQVPLPPPYLSEWDTQMIRLQQQHRPYQPHFPRRNASWAPLPQRVRRDRIPGVLVHGPGGYQLASEARGIASFNPETYQPLPWEEGFGRRASTENRQSGGSGLQRLARFVTGSDRSGGQDRNSGSAGSEKDRPRRSGLRGKLKDMVDKTKRIIR